MPQKLVDWCMLVSVAQSLKRSETEVLLARVYIVVVQVRVLMPICYRHYLRSKFEYKCYFECSHRRGINQCVKYKKGVVLRI